MLNSGNPLSWKVALLLGACLSCRGNETLAPVPVPAPVASAGAPTRLTIVSGNDQRGIAGEQRAADIVVKVEDDSGRPVPHVQLALVDTVSGQSSLIPVTRAIATTESAGLATFVRPGFGLKPGLQLYIVRLVSDSTKQLPVRGTALAGAPARIDASNFLLGYATGPVNGPTFIIRDRNDNPVPGVRVDFAVGAAGGSISNASAVSDSLGLAVVAVFTLGPQVGNYQLTATAGALTATAIAVARSGPPARIDLVSGGGQQVAAGGVIPTPVRIRVLDAAGVGVPNAVVRWTSDATGASCTSLTATDGQATSCVLPLGATPGEQRVSVSSVSASTSFTAVVVEPVARVEFVDPVEARAVYPPGTTAVNLAVKLTLRSGAPAVGYTVVLSGAPKFDFSPPIAASTDGRGIATFRVTLPATVPIRPDTAMTVPYIARAELAVAPSDTVIVVISGRLRFEYIAAGGAHTCAATFNEVYCWGRNQEGQLGNGSSMLSVSPTLSAFQLLPRLSSVYINVTSVTAGRSHSCATDFAFQQVGRGPGGVFIPRTVCWGSNASGQVGPATGPTSTPIVVSTRIGQPSAGASHTCGITAEKAAWCWGDNRFGALGDGTAASRSAPAPVVATQLGTLVNSVAAGDAFTCALNITGVAYCWGRNDQGQLGEGTRTDRLVPTLVSRELFFNPSRPIVAGDAHACAIATDGGAFCWGRNDQGQLGDGTTSSRSSPTLVAGSLAFVSLSAGAAHTCGVTAAGDVYCWGANESGQLGIGTSGVASAAPVHVSGALKYRVVSAGRAHTCALVPSVSGYGGAAYCWGLNTDGQLGDGTTVNRPVPTPVSDFR